MVHMVSSSGNHGGTMGNRETRRSIKDAIVELTGARTPVCTAGEIAEEVGLSKPSVNNNIDAVVESNTEIRRKMAGQTPVYYVDAGFRHLPMDDDVHLYGHLETTPAQPARMYQLVDAGEDSEFDYVVRWFDAQGNELEDYAATGSEIGEIASRQAANPIAIKYRDENRKMRTVQRKGDTVVDSSHERLDPNSEDVNVEVEDDA